jgi:hypothetical protein
MPGQVEVGHVPELVVCECDDALLAGDTKRGPGPDGGEQVR